LICGFLPKSRYGRRWSSTKEFVEVIVRTDPDPNNLVTPALANGAVLFVDAD
jgi:hypothetical protein